MRGFLYFCLGFLLLSVVTFAIAGKRGSLSRKPPIEVIPDMDRQPKIRPQTPNAFFADGRSSRLPVQGTVARGAAYQDIPMNTGRETGTTNFVAVNPLPVNEVVMARGRERYEISNRCSARSAHFRHHTSSLFCSEHSGLFSACCL